jgi:RNA polymerase sigma factor (sigma-70 family)
LNEHQLSKNQEEKAMSQKQYRVNINGALVDVTEEQYLAYYRSQRRMRYFERDIKTETAIRDKDGNVTGYAPSKEDSLDRLLERGDDFADEAESAEDSLVKTALLEKLSEVLGELPAAERELIDALFFSNSGDGMTEREYAKISGIPRKTIAYRREKVLGKLKKLLGN